MCPLLSLVASSLYDSVSRETKEGLMAKVLSKSDSGFGVKAGPSGQVGKTSGPARSVGQQKPGVASQEGSGGGKYAVGGNSSMQPFSGSNPRNAGSTAGAPGKGGQKWAEGGNDHMQPHRGSVAAVPGKTSAY